MPEGEEDGGRNEDDGSARASIGVPLGWPLPPILVSRTFFEADERE